MSTYNLLYSFQYVKICALYCKLCLNQVSVSTIKLRWGSGAQGDLTAGCKWMGWGRHRIIIHTQGKTSKCLVWGCMLLLKHRAAKELD